MLRDILRYTQVLNRGGRRVRSPLNGLRKTAFSESVGIIRTGRSAYNQTEVVNHTGSIMNKGLPSAGGFVLGRPGPVLSRSA